MLTSERPGIFVGRAYNTESWYVVDTTYAKFEKQVVAEWRERYRGSNRPGWVRPVLFIVLPLLMFGLSIAAIAAEASLALPVVPLALVLGLAIFILGFRLADIRWPGKPAAEGHIHAVVPIDPELVQAATDGTAWRDIWEVSVSLYRTRQAHEVSHYLDAVLEIMHSPEERKVLSDARDAIVALREKRDEEFAATTQWSTMFHTRLGIPDNGEAL
jgi:hypothetical protein